MKVSKIALAAALSIGGSALLVTTAAEAQRAPGGGESRSSSRQEEQRKEQRQQQQQGESDLKLSNEEVAALQPLQTAAQAKDWAAAKAAMPAADAAAQGPDAKYFVARTKFIVGNQSGDVPVEIQGLDALLAHPKTPPADMAALLSRRAELAFSASDFATAERMFERLLQLTPNDQRVLNNLAIVRSRMGDSSGVLDALRQTVETAEAGGQRAEEASYRRLLTAAIDAGQADLATRTAGQLLAAYPTSENWRLVIHLHREGVRPNAQHELDILRLQRVAGALEGEGDYVVFADELNRGGLPGEAQAVLQEGIQRNQISMTRQPVRELSELVESRVAGDRASLAGQRRQATSAANGRMARIVGDALYGYGEYADAAEMYRLALQKGGEDANTLNTRLGAALALAGQSAEAKAAFGSVTGPRRGLADYWLIWLDKRGN